jgi:hypothetical protein
MEPRSLFGDVAASAMKVAALGLLVIMLAAGCLVPAGTPQEEKEERSSRPVHTASDNRPRYTYHDITRITIDFPEAPSLSTLPSTTVEFNDTVERVRISTRFAPRTLVTPTSSTTLGLVDERLNVKAYDGSTMKAMHSYTPIWAIQGVTFSPTFTSEFNITGNTLRFEPRGWGAMRADISVYEARPVPPEGNASGPQFKSL